MDVPGESEVWTPRARAAVGRFDPRRTVVRRLMAPPVSLACRGLMQVLNTLEIHHGERLYEAQHRAREEGRGLLTFSNHVSLFDDPWLMACLCRPWWDDVRWIATDALNFFDHPLTAWFFGAGKGVPIVRGAGVDQPGMRFLAERLRAGEWVHVFPEGTRSREPERVLTPLKSGLANLVRDGRPLLLPFHHRGMEKVLPIGARWPRVGQVVSVRFGRVTDSAPELCARPLPEITAWAQEELLALEREAGGPRPGP